MNHQKQRKKLVALLIALAMIFTVLPTNLVKAAATYTLKCSAGNEKQIIYAKDPMTLYLNVTLLKNGKEVDLNKEKNLKIKWKSSDNSVVKIVNIVSKTRYDYYWGKDVQSIYAEVAGLKKGKATVTASCKGESCSFDITVRGGTIVPRYSDSQMAYVPAQSSMDIQLKGDGWDELSTDDVKIASSNQSIAKVKKDGYGYYILQGVKQGKTTITATSKLGTLKMKVVVLPQAKLRWKKGSDIKKGDKVIGY